MTAAALNFTVPTSSLPNLSAGMAGTGMTQKIAGAQSFSEALQSHETKTAPKSQDQGPTQSGSASKTQHPGSKPDKAGKSDRDDTQQKTQDAAQEATTDTQTAARTAKPGSQTGKDGKLLSDGKDLKDDATDDAGLLTDPDPSVLAAMNAANMAAQPASDAGKNDLTLTDGVVDKQDDDITSLLLKEGPDDKAEAEKLFQLGSTDEAGKTETAVKTDKDSHFGSLLNQTLDKQGASTLQGNSQAAAAVANTATGNTAPVRQVVATPVATQGWTEEVAQKVSWTAHNGNGRAELVLTPAHMGRIEVSIHMHGDQASATFIAANAHAREALQDAMPQLREVLSNAGIQLGQANVSANSSGQNWSGTSDQSGFQGGSYTSHGGNPVDVGLEGIGTHSATAWSSGGNGLVDIFA